MHIILHMILSGNLNWQDGFKKPSPEKRALRKYLLLFLKFQYIPPSYHENLTRPKSLAVSKHGSSPCLSCDHLSLWDLFINTKEMQILYSYFNHIQMIKKKITSTAGIQHHITKSYFRTALSKVHQTYWVFIVWKYKWRPQHFTNKRPVCSETEWKPASRVHA